MENYFRSREYSDNLITASLNNPHPIRPSEQAPNVEPTNTDERIVPGGELYLNIKNFFRTHLDHVIQVSECLIQLIELICSMSSKKETCKMKISSDSMPNFGKAINRQVK